MIIFSLSQQEKLCAHCKALLKVPRSLPRFSCPQCGVDVSKIRQFPPHPAAQPQPQPQPQPQEEVNEVTVEVEREEDECGIAGETFMDYRPAKLSIGPPHPDPIVETSSLSAVEPPEPTYNLKIKDDLEGSTALSCLQIETLVYACQRHLQFLPDGNRAGFFIGDGAGVGKGRTIAGLIWENWHHGRRKALWISIGSDLKYDARRDMDDVGAMCVETHALNKLPYSKLDSMSVGVREGVVFLTYSSLIASSESRTRLQQLVQWCGLEFDGLIVFDECHKAKNLVAEAGGQPTRTGKAVLEIQERLPQARVVYCSATGASEPRNMAYMVRLGLWGTGTAFLDFSDFLGAMEEGGVGALEVVAMDMKARGMYVCRTLSYKGAEFEVVEVPLEAKMQDMYKKAAEFWAQLRVELLSASESSSNQLRRLYWATHQRFFKHMCMSAKVPTVVRLAKEALAENKCVVIGLQSTGEARTKEAVSKYGVKLDDFFSGPRELLLKFVEKIYPLPEESAKELQRKRHAAAPGVSSRGRVRKVAKLQTSDQRSDEKSETDLGYEFIESDDDESQICDICNSEAERKELLKCSCCGHFVHPTCIVPPVVESVSADWVCHSCKEKTNEYIPARHGIFDIIHSLDLPNNPLDDIIDQLGGPEKVAEITGRKGMLVRASGGKGVTYQARNTKDVSMEMVNIHEKQLFMGGKKLVAIISEAGSAGVSLQADRRALNQRRRVHLTLELPWSADRAIQQFGRTHRSNQASAPVYKPLFTNLGGERRFASIVAKRLESLGALTQGDRRARPPLSAYNYDTSYGKRALETLYRGIMEQVPLPVVPPGCSADEPDTIQDFILKGKAALVSVGIIRDLVLGGRIVDSDMRDVGRFLNRLLGLPPEIQNSLFELFASIHDLLVENARLGGHLDSGIVEIKANSVKLKGMPKTVHVDNLSGASTLLFTFTLDRGLNWESACVLLEEKQKGESSSTTKSGFYESKREWLGRRHFLLALEGSASGRFKVFRPAVGEASREMPLKELQHKYRKSSLEKAHHRWENEYEVSSKQCMHGPKCNLGRFCTVGRRIKEVNVLGGVILPVWGTVKKVLSEQTHLSHRRIRIVQIVTTTDNQQTVGLLIPNAAVESLLQDLKWVQDVDEYD